MTPGYGRYFLILFILSIPLPIRAGEPVERIAAVVNGQILFLSDLKRASLFFGPQDENRAPVRLPSDQLKEAIDHLLLRKEARRFVLQGPSEEEVDQRVKQIRERFEKEHAFLQALDEVGLSLEELREEAREHLWVERLLEERIHSFIFISPKQVEKYYQDHPKEFVGKKQAEVEAEIRRRLTEEREAQKIKEYLARLREQADIQVNLN